MAAKPAKDRALVARLRAALTASQARRYTVAEILSCGCEPHRESCAQCDSRHAANARIDEAARTLAEPGNVAALLSVLDARETET